MQVELADGAIDFAYWTHPAEKLRPPAQAELDELRRFIRPGDVCIDIGAKTGDTSVPLALAAGPDGVCLAIDPNPHPFPVLEENAKLIAGRGTILTIQIAIAPTNGSMTLYYSDPHFHNGGAFPGISRLSHGHLFPLDVTARRLDSVLSDYSGMEERLRYIKIDAEGYDFEILKSIGDLIRRLRPYIRMEVLRRLPPDTRMEIFDYLSQMDYRIWRMTNAAHLRGAPLQRETMIDIENFDIFAEPIESMR